MDTMKAQAIARERYRTREVTTEELVAMPDNCRHFYERARTLPWPSSFSEAGIGTVVKYADGQIGLLPTCHAPLYTEILCPWQPVKTEAELGDGYWRGVVEKILSAEDQRQKAIKLALVALKELPLDDRYVVTRNQTGTWFSLGFDMITIPGMMFMVEDDNTITELLQLIDADETLQRAARRHRRHDRRRSKVMARYREMLWDDFDKAKFRLDGENATSWPTKSIPRSPPEKKSLQTSAAGRQRNIRPYGQHTVSTLIT